MYLLKYEPYYMTLGICSSSSNKILIKNKTRNTGNTS